jgi:drug/metabolite transporter (DMT)-like permease
LGGHELICCLGLLGSAFGWALGSLFSKRWKLAVDPFTAAAYQMAFAGAVSMVSGMAIGEWSRATWSWRGLSATAYLVVFGSWVGYTAYIWLLSHVPTAKVSTYSYVNPVIAVFLGWLVLHESITGYILAGTFIVVLAVALVTGAKLKTRSAEPSSVTAAQEAVSVVSP